MQIVSSKIKAVRKIALSIMVVILFQGICAATEEGCKAYISNETYHKVLDGLFPIDGAIVRGEGARMSLRFVPWRLDLNEYQINIRLVNNDYFVELIDVPGNLSLWEEMQKFCKSEFRQDPTILAKHLASKLRKTKLDIPAKELQSLVGQTRTMALDLAPPNPNSATISEGTYEFVYQDPITNIRIKRFDSIPSNDPKAHPLIKWMNEVNVMIRKYLK